MLVDGDAVVDLMPYSIFKKLGREDDELMRTNLMLNGMGGNSMEARGVMSMELIEVQGNYSVILCRDCIPSTLHQFLIQWIDGEIEIVHVDASAHITLSNAMTDWQHGSIQCLSGTDLTSYDFLSVSKNGFVLVSMQLTSGTQLEGVVFQ
jgi:hypothetical protein